MIRPIYILLVAVSLASTAADQSAQTLEPNKTGYSTVAIALDALKDKPGTKVTVSEKWTTIEDMEGKDTVLWSFTHPGHAAHPSAVKRTLQTRADGYYVEMNVLCEAEKAACGALVRSFEALNERVRQSVRDGK